jgi:hypothetical protein
MRRRAVYFRSRALPIRLVPEHRHAPPPHSRRRPHVAHANLRRTARRRRRPARAGPRAPNQLPQAPARRQVPQRRHGRGRFQLRRQARYLRRLGLLRRARLDPGPRGRAGPGVRPAGLQQLVRQLRRRREPRRPHRPVGGGLSGPAHLVVRAARQPGRALEAAHRHLRDQQRKPAVPGHRRRRPPRADLCHGRADDPGPPRRRPQHHLGGAKHLRPRRRPHRALLSRPGHRRYRPRRPQRHRRAARLVGGGVPRHERRVAVPSCAPGPGLRPDARLGPAPTPTASGGTSSQPPAGRRTRSTPASRRRTPCAWPTSTATACRTL